MRSTRSGFTLVELLIVITILGIMAMVVVPQFVGASTSSRGVALADQLRIFREQMNLYRAQHQARWPGLDGDGTPSSDVAAFTAQLTTFTDRKGNTTSAKSSTFCYGPYLPGVPANPISGLKTVAIDTGIGTPTPDGSTGWIYQPATGRLWPNNTGSDGDGKAYFSY